MNVTGRSRGDMLIAKRFSEFREKIRVNFFDMKLLTEELIHAQGCEKIRVNHQQHTKHVMYKLGYHFVWCPKYRKRILTGKVAVFVAEEIRRLCEVNGWRVGALNVQEDHVHLLTSCSPICRAFADCACFERSNRPEGVSTFSFRQETALGRCFLGSVLLCRRCWGYECGDCAQIHRIGARINAMHSETFQKAFIQGRRDRKVSPQWGKRKSRVKQVDSRCRMEHVYRNGERQGSMGRAHRCLCKPIHVITTLPRMRYGGQKRPFRAVAQVQLWHRTRQGHQFCKAHPELRIPTTFGRDAANFGNGVEASGQRPEVRSQESPKTRE